jgi:hypothetical protein
VKIRKNNEINMGRKCTEIARPEIIIKKSSYTLKVEDSRVDI